MRSLSVVVVAMLVAAASCTSRPVGAQPPYTRDQAVSCRIDYGRILEVGREADLGLIFDRTHYATSLDRLLPVLRDVQQNGSGLMEPELSEVLPLLEGFREETAEPMTGERVTEIGKILVGLRNQFELNAPSPGFPYLRAACDRIDDWIYRNVPG